MIGWLFKVIDVLLGIAIRADEVAERRRRRQRELLGTGGAKRSVVPTVVLPRPTPTSPTTAGVDVTPTEPIPLERRR